MTYVVRHFGREFLRETFQRHFEPEFWSCISVHKLKHCKNIVIEGRCHLFSASLFSPPPMTIIIAMPNRHKMRSENEEELGLSPIFSHQKLSITSSIFLMRSQHRPFSSLWPDQYLSLLFYIFTLHVSKSHVTNKCNLRGFEHMR